MMANRGHIQSERAASAQRDLFDNQIRIEDQLIEQKSEPNHQGSKLDPSIAVQIDAVINSTRQDAERQAEIAVEDYLSGHGLTIRTLTDTFNNKL